MDIKEAKKELLEIKKDNESKAMIINNNSSNVQIRWSNKDLKEMSEISQRCAREIRAIEVVLSELEKKEAIINEMSKFIANLKLSWFKKEDGGEFLGKYRFYNQEEWIEYFTNKVEREGK